MLENNPYINQLHAIEDGVENLKALAFDWIIDLHHNLRTFQVKRALGVRFWDSFAQSSKVSKSISTIIQLVFLILALSSCFLWIT